jgi:hypothetical protein
VCGRCQQILSAAAHFVSLNILVCSLTFTVKGITQVVKCCMLYSGLFPGFCSLTLCRPKRTGTYVNLNVHWKKHSLPAQAVGIQIGPAKG